METLQAVIQTLGLIGLLVEGCVLLIPDRLDQLAAKLQRSADVTAEARTKVRAARDLARIKRRVLRSLVRISSTEEDGHITYLRAVPPRSVPTGLRCSLVEFGELYTEIGERFASGWRILDPYVYDLHDFVDAFVRTHHPELDQGSPRFGQPGAVVVAIWAVLLAIPIAWVAVFHVSTTQPSSLVLVACGSALVPATIFTLLYISDIARAIAHPVTTFTAALVRTVRSEVARKFAYLCVAFYVLDVAQALSDMVRWSAAALGTAFG